MSKDYTLTYRPYGESALLIEWPQQIDEDILEDILLYKKALQAQQFSDLTDIVGAYASITLFFSAPHHLPRLLDTLKQCYHNRHQYMTSGRQWKVPVCYDEPLGIDLASLSEKLNLPTTTIIDLHTAVPYKVYFMGFLPGFPYLGGLDRRLHCPRKDTPRLRTPKGAVGIGGEQTGIYPLESPGGWHIIGNCPVSFFSSASTPPCFLQPGDSLYFERISKDEHARILNLVEKGRYELTQCNP